MTTSRSPRRPTHLVDARLVAGGVLGVEGQGLDPAGAAPARAGAAAGLEAVGSPAGQHDRGVAGRGQLGRDGQRRSRSEPPSTRMDCTAPRASFTRLPIVGSTSGHSRRARSDCSRWSGSSSVADLPPPGQLGVHGGQQLGPQPGVLGQVDPAAGVHHQVVDPVEQAGQARAGRRDVQGQGPAGQGERQRPGVGGAEALEDRQERGAPGLAERGQDGPQRRPRHRRGRRTGTARSPAGRRCGSSRPTPSSGWKEARRSTRCCPSSNLGALRNHSSLKAATVARLSRPEGAHGGALMRCGREKASARREERCWRRQVVAAGVVAPGSTERPSDVAAGQAVDPRHRVAVLVVGLEHPGHQRVEVGHPLGVDPHAGRSRPAAVRMVASRITPVRPMPPAVAQNTSGVRGRADTASLPSAGVSEHHPVHVGGRSCRRRGGSCRGCRTRWRRRRSPGGSRGHHREQPERAAGSASAGRG